VGLPGFEPESIEPKCSKTVDWEEYKQYLLSKHCKGYAVSLFEHSKKYFEFLDNVNGIQLAKPTSRNNIINGLVALSKYLGSYELFMKNMATHGIKRVKPDPIQAFSRIFNSDAHKGLGEWYKSALAVLDDNEKLYLRFVMLSGVRAMEGINSFNLIVELGSKYSIDYYNEETGFLEHFKYPKLFLRDSKNLYISAVPKELLDEISRSKIVSYNAIDKKLDRAGLPMRVKRLRSYFATTMRENGLLSEQIDLVQGRVGKSIFLQHYFKQDAKLLNSKILTMLLTLENSVI
jgi:intergrase/recombinase